METIGSNPFETFISELAQAAAENNPVVDGDYVNEEDGLVYCGKCHTPKQARVKTPSGEELIFAGSCKCVREAFEEQKRQDKLREQMMEIDSLRHKHLMDGNFRQKNFTNFAETEENARVLKICKRYADKFDELCKKNQGLLLYGGVGTGKSYAAACIANALLDKGTPVVMTSFVKLLENIKNEIPADFSFAKLLIIDDLGAERCTDYALEKVYGIIDARYRSELPLIITTNLDIKEMRENGDVRYERIFDRLIEVCYPVKFSGLSHRKKEAKKRFDEMKALLEG